MNTVNTDVEPRTEAGEQDLGCPAWTADDVAACAWVVGDHEARVVLLHGPGLLATSFLHAGLVPCLRHSFHVLGDVEPLTSRPVTEPPAPPAPPAPLRRVAAAIYELASRGLELQTPRGPVHLDLAQACAGHASVDHFADAVVDVGSDDALATLVRIGERLPRTLVVVVDLGDPGQVQAREDAALLELLAQLSRADLDLRVAVCLDTEHYEELRRQLRARGADDAHLRSFCVDQDLPVTDPATNLGDPGDAQASDGQDVGDTDDDGDTDLPCPHGDYRSCVVDDCRPLRRVRVAGVIVPPPAQVPCMWCSQLSERGQCTPCRALLDAISATPADGVLAIVEATRPNWCRGSRPKSLPRELDPASPGARLLSCSPEFWAREASLADLEVAVRDSGELDEQRARVLDSVYAERACQLIARTREFPAGDHPEDELARLADHLERAAHDSVRDALDALGPYYARWRLLSELLLRARTHLVAWRQDPHLLRRPGVRMLLSLLAQQGTYAGGPRPLRIAEAESTLGVDLGVDARLLEASGIVYRRGDGAGAELWLSSVGRSALAEVDAPGPWLADAPRPDPRTAPPASEGEDTEVRLITAGEIHGLRPVELSLDEVVRCVQTGTVFVEIELERHADALARLAELTQAVWQHVPRLSHPFLVVVPPRADLAPEVRDSITRAGALPFFAPETYDLASYHSTRLRTLRDHLRQLRASIHASVQKHTKGDLP